MLMNSTWTKNDYGINFIVNDVINKEPYTVKVNTGYSGAEVTKNKVPVKKPFYMDIDRKIKKVILNNPATIILWKDGTKTVVKCQDCDEYDPEKGFAMAVIKYLSGNQGNFNDLFKKWVWHEKK